MSYGRPYILKIDGCIHDGWILLSDFDERLNKNYLYEILSSQFVQDQFHYLADGGTSVDNLNISRVESVVIPLPPIEIQNKIIEAILKVEKEESTIKSRIKESKNTKFELLKSEKRIELRKYLLNINPNKSDSIKDLSDDAEVSFLSMENVSNSGEIMHLQSRPLSAVKTGYTFFQEEDILFAKITPCMENGKGCYVNTTLNNNVGFGSTEFFVLRPDTSKIYPAILHLMTQSNEFRLEAEKNMTGTSGHRRVPKEFVENYSVPLLTLAEQKPILKKLKSLDSRLEKLNAELAEIPNKKAQVMDKYLK